MKIIKRIKRPHQPLLTCDDPEHWPLVGYGFVIQQALMERLGFSEDVLRHLEEKAKELAKIRREGWYHIFANLAQEWAEEQAQRTER